MSPISKVIKAHQPALQHYHTHPELSFQDKETGTSIVSHTSALEAYEVFPRIGDHGVAVVLKNGQGRTILLHADLDGLAVEEKTRIHSCGRDMHVTALLAAAEALASAKNEWNETLILVFQPAGKTARGAQVMMDDTIGTKHGLMASAADSFHHASTPNRSIDPDYTVITVSAIHAGDAENIIPDRADIGLIVRSVAPFTQERVLSSICRIIDAEASALNAPQPPELNPTTQFLFLFNDAEVTSALEKAFSAYFPPASHGYDLDIPRLSGSDDFEILATVIGKPSCLFLYGGLDPKMWDKAEKEGKLLELAVNHSPYLALVIEPTLTVAVDGYVAAALTFLEKHT
ncbi:hypothetical protein K469DRAFT_731009 [Zopfia rhizophila CBS 207.26]|uniref:Peptidase M20 dimerisation domain-containing protein n=1 Tax=Zopfia rhizophila CBS 207.26 TaxID=1314779 RepID=A0A6A6ELN2_9PEZI|nr:hypothetical protein K469DRAFT_731009 [Zopfia rhizophila CBS 207.26]